MSAMKTHKATAAALTIPDRELIVRALRALVSEEQQKCVRHAREKYVIDDGRGGHKSFSGGWDELVECSRICDDYTQKPIREAEALAASVEKLVGKLQP